MYYFGKWASGHGHILYHGNGRQVYHNEMPKDFPVREHILDGGLLPPELPQVEGRASLTHVNGWTILSFWDRSGDKRGNSCSNFLMRGTHYFKIALLMAREGCPDLWSRITFDIVEYRREENL